nr:helix-turn-helix transcriptional regulator [uncultured Acetatifactor sp.]
MIALDTLTTNVSAYIKKMGITLTKVSKDTGIPYRALYDSLSNKDRGRDLKAKEFIAVCEFLGVDPMDFADKEAGGR